MITDRIDPPELLKIPEIVNVSVATGTHIIHISGQTAVAADGKVAGTTHLEQCSHTLSNLRTALEAAGATPARRRQVQRLHGGLQLGTRSKR